MLHLSLAEGYYSWRVSTRQVMTRKKRQRDEQVVKLFKFISETYQFQSTVCLCVCVVLFCFVLFLFFQIETVGLLYLSGILDNSKSAKCKVINPIRKVENQINHDVISSWYWTLSLWVPFWRFIVPPSCRQRQWLEGCSYQLQRHLALISSLAETSSCVMWNIRKRRNLTLQYEKSLEW